MNTRDESALCSACVRGHQLGCFDLDAMNRAGRSVRVAANARIGAAAVGTRRTFAGIILIARIAARNFRSVRDTGAFGHGMSCPYCGNVKVKINDNCAGETPAVRTATARAEAQDLALGAD